MKGCLLLLCTLIWVSSYGQNNQLLYNFDSQPQALLSNPGAAITFEKHIGIPLLSGLSIHAGSSGISAYDIFREGGDINQAINDAVNTLSDTDFFTAHQQLEIFSFGWKSPTSDVYFSGGLYQEFDAFIYYPRDIALLAYRGNAEFIGTPFDFSDVSFTVDALTTYHFGVNKKINDKWQLGARGKLYSSIANVNSTKNRGSFITELTPNGPNFYAHRIRNAEVVANTSGLDFDSDSEEEDIGPGTFIGRGILSGNLGLGVDIGATYTIDEHWTATGSLVDIGFIRHSKDTKRYSGSGNFTVEGIELQFPAAVDGVATTPYFEDLRVEVKDNLNLENGVESEYTVWRPLKVNASLQYGFGDGVGSGDCNCFGSSDIAWKNKAGVQLYSIKRPKGLKGAVTAYYDRTWASFLRTKFTYTVDPFSAKNVGALVSTRIYNFNLYLAADNLLELPNLAKAHSASLQLGMQLVFDPK